MQFSTGPWACGPWGWNGESWAIPFVHGPLGFLLSLFFVFLVGYILISIFKTYGADSVKQDLGIEIVRQRYAKGEISKEEYLQMKSDLIS